MAVKLIGLMESGISNPKFVRFRASDGAVWSTTLSGYESYNASNVANYGIAATEVGATGTYTTTDPDENTPGTFQIVAAAGSNLATGDLPSNVRGIGTAEPQKPTLAEIFAGGDVDGYTLEETLKLCLSALAGKLSGAATTTITIRAADDSKNRIVATVDSNGNRSAVTLDETG